MWISNSSTNHSNSNKLDEFIIINLKFLPKSYHPNEILINSIYTYLQKEKENKKNKSIYTLIHHAYLISSIKLFLQSFLWGSLIGEVWKCIVWAILSILSMIANFFIIKKINNNNSCSYIWLNYKHSWSTIFPFFLWYTG